MVGFITDKIAAATHSAGTLGLGAISSKLRGDRHMGRVGEQWRLLQQESRGSWWLSAPASNGSQRERERERRDAVIKPHQPRSVYVLDHNYEHRH